MPQPSEAEPSGLQPINPGITILNDAPCGAQATIVATGLGRSGTTMLARCLSALDIPMGPRTSARTGEDKEFVPSVKENDRDAFRALCRVRDAQHDKWGFKLPAMRGRLASFLPEARNPRVIVVFRDLLAVSLRNNLTFNADFLQDMHKAAAGYARMIQQLEQIDSPTLLISYEKALLNPGNCVAAIAGFCGVSMSDEVAAEIGRRVIRNSDRMYLGG